MSLYAVARFDAVIRLASRSGCVGGARYARSVRPRTA